MLFVLRVLAMFVLVFVHFILLFMKAWKEEVRIDNAEVGQICHQYLFSEQMLNWLFYPFFIISLVSWLVFCWLNGKWFKQHAFKIMIVYSLLIMIWIVFFHFINHCLVSMI